MDEELNEMLHKMRGSITPMVGLGDILRQWLEKQDKNQLKEIDFYNEICLQTDRIGVRMKELVMRLDAWADKYMSKERHSL